MFFEKGERDDVDEDDNTIVRELYYLEHRV